jgi:hypothetical protein
LSNICNKNQKNHCPKDPATNTFTCKKMIVEGPH